MVGSLRLLRFMRGHGATMESKTVALKDFTVEHVAVLYRKVHYLEQKVERLTEKVDFLEDRLNGFDGANEELMWF